MTEIQASYGRSPRLVFILLALTLAVDGCGAKSVPGGTNGTLQTERGPMSDIQITLHRFDGAEYQAVGFGVSDAEGRFQLYANGAMGPLWLPPDEYSCTLESAGSPIRIPPEYSDAESTPLKFSWQSNDGQLDIEIQDFE